MRDEFVSVETYHIDYLLELIWNEIEVRQQIRLEFRKV